MIGFWKSLSGMLEVELTSGAPEVRLWEFSEQEIAVYQVNRIADLCIRFCIHRRDLTKLTKICEKKGDSLIVRNRMGLYFLFSSAGKRPILVAGISVLLLLTWILPSRVLFLRVEGNDLVPEKYILEAASDCGIGFGTRRRSIRSEQVKNELLQRIPQLKWAGVNSYGCVAVISVRETSQQDQTEFRSAVSNMVALRDGVVLDCTATKGNLLCKPGDAVRQGQILISGYTDCGRIIQATNAEGEVFAQTRRSIRVINLRNGMSKVKKAHVGRSFSLIIGKKRINLWKDSGIWDASCGRMYQEYVLTLPGGFHLPVALCVETFTRYNLSETGCESVDVSEQLQSYAEEYLVQQMNSGRIQAGEFRIFRENGTVTLEGDYICTEMIGRIQPEQIGEEHGKTD